MRKIVAQKLLEVVGGKPKVVRYCDNRQVSNIDIYIGLNRPADGVTTYATIGLSDYDIELELPMGKALRIEFIGACSNDYDNFANVISSCAFNIINSNYSCCPGTVYPYAVQEYYKEFEMKHILFVTPFLCDTLSNIETTDKTIAWLMPVPISDSELEYLKKEGVSALEDLFEQNEIDVFNLERPSVV